METRQIREHTPVVDPMNVQFATVDRVEGEYIKLTRDKSGQHHYLPLQWVTSVDDEDKVHIDRPRDAAIQDWKSAADVGA